MIDWDNAFDNSAYVPESQDLLDAWAKEAESYRTSMGGNAMLDQAYGPDPREILDVFTPDTEAKGTVIFVHGGYWRRLDKSYWSHLAQGALAHGWQVVMPSYPLTPHVTIAQITKSIAAAVAKTANDFAGPIRLAGHSAGGHLVSRMACQGVLAPEVAARIARVISISGVHQLGPLLNIEMNETLGLTPQMAEEESPITHEPLKNVPITFWVGAEERPEFLRQTRIGAEVWGLNGADVSSEYERGLNHFTVVASLAEKDGSLTKALLADTHP